MKKIIDIIIKQLNKNKAKKEYNDYLWNEYKISSDKNKKCFSNFDYNEMTINNM